MGDFLKDKIELGSQLSIVSAYFTIYAFEALKQELCSIDSLNFLFGEPRFIQSIGTNTDRKSFKIEDTGIQLSSRLRQSKLARECQEWIQKKVNIRSIKQSNLLHGKMYHIDNNGVKTAILGSSNFTLKGLGLAKVNSNIELNLIVDSERDRQDLKFWFEELWNNHKLVQDVKHEIISYLNQLYQDNAPEFIYYKTLYHLFKRFLDQQAANDLLSKQRHLTDTKIWNLLFDFQKDGVKGAINKIMEYNGCIIADSVGLGKTFEALAIIKYFELLNYKVLVLCPKKLRSNWTIYHAANNSELNILVEDRFNYTVLSHTDLSRDTGYSGDINLETLNWSNYDLVVIDESHNFRNNTKGKRDEDGNVIKKSRYQRLMQDIIQKGIPTRVLLLSATPVNTDLKDLRNQINFIVEDKDSAFSQTLGIDSIKQTLTTAQKEFTLWAKKKQHHSNELLENLNSSFFTLLDGLTIARSRQHIKKYYQETIAQLGGFPERLKPVSLFSHIDLEDNFLDYDDINEQISDYQLSLFNPSNYVLEEYQHLYEGEVVQNNFTQSNRENYLIGMMKVNFLKRLESSVYSFRITLERTIDKIRNLESKIKKFGQHQIEIIKSEDYEIESFDDEELEAAFEVGRELKYQLEHLDIDRWLFDLARDRRQLHKLYIQAKDVNVCRDAKLADLKQIIEDKVTNPTLNKQSKENKKVIIFTAFADTAKYLYDALVGWVTTELNINMALVRGGNGGNKTTFGSYRFEEILTNFSPIAKQRDKIKSMPQKGEIDILIATDCISEGQNLQDCDYLVNYDIHWNPVRIIQRFGRIDRIGSLNHTVQLVNFWPTDDLNNYINLKNRVEARMALVDITATGEDNVLNVDELQDLLTEDMSYRDQQLLRLKDEVLDIEDFNETISLTEFSLDDFRIDLLNYLQQNRQLLENAPLGLYGIVPTHQEYDVIKPGIIFCLQQMGNTSGNEQVNPLQPYFLVYVRDDGNVRYTFAQPKQILEIYRLLCAGKTQPYNDLCQLFNQRTNNGSSMSNESDLLDKAVHSITRTFTKRVSKNLFKSGKEGIMPLKEQQVTKTTDFELITWLIIQDDATT
ncbi:helicase-related protein [Nodularia spumigena CS-336/02]|uniref:helicase-related protein n=1 Tax=Cyanophyceae TaxID=3028117 RepID=UPI00232E88F7|nr:MULTISPECIES: helicase-related protein [Cyanophyceae]MDB9355563.1 helicase-related protein [Nodularia spumigena CS-587/03]MDB9497871.1 helicase-related protein [Nodularia spumigena CS-336/02]MDB9339641.1 helicase-related protein [Nodularia spumigena CS-589/07]MDB9400121.1 helicase-related protein [Microcystis aeruginosa CS-567/02-A1]MDB9530188.1 helicase-related protein [Nodularia spumigena CS-1038]